MIADTVRSLWDNFPGKVQGFMNALVPSILFCLRCAVMACPLQIISRPGRTAKAIVLTGFLFCALLNGQARPMDAAKLKGEAYGVVIDEAGRTISGVNIQAEQVYDVNGRPAVLSRNTVTSGVGRFAFRDLEPGTWRFCGTIVNSTLLDPCEWNSAPTIYLGAGQNVLGLRVLLVQGQRIFVRIDDPDKRLKANSNGKKDSFVRVGVVEGARFRSAVRIAEDASGEDHTIVIPRSRELGLSIRGVNVEFDGDDKGKKVDLGTGRDDVAKVNLKDGDGPRTVKVFTKAAKK
jgi:hypothetical protein